MKNKVILLVLFGIVMVGIGVGATTIINANQVSYNNKTVDQALNDLYDKANNSNTETYDSAIQNLDAKQTIINSSQSKIVGISKIEFKTPITSRYVESIAINNNNITINKNNDSAGNYTMQAAVEFVNSTKSLTEVKQTCHVGGGLSARGAIVEIEYPSLTKIVGISKIEGTLMNQYNQMEGLWISGNKLYYSMANTGNTTATYLDVDITVVGY